MANVYYTYRIRYIDKKVDIEGNDISEYKLCSIIGNDIAKVVNDWYYDVSKELGVEDPFTILWILTNWNVADKERVEGKNIKGIYWSGEKEDEQFFNLMDEIERIFFISLAIGKDEYFIYNEFLKRGYTLESFKGTEYYDWAKTMNRKYGWHQISA